MNLKTVWLISFLTVGLLAKNDAKSVSAFKVCGDHVGCYQTDVQSETFKKVVSIVVDKLGVEESECTLYSIFAIDLEADADDMDEIILEFEREWDIIIPEEFVDSMITIRHAVDIIDELRSE